jgi:hypothetical protein
MEEIDTEILSRYALMIVYLQAKFTALHKVARSKEEGLDDADRAAGHREKPVVSPDECGTLNTIGIHHRSLSTIGEREANQILKDRILDLPPSGLPELSELAPREFKPPNVRA